MKKVIFISFILFTSLIFYQCDSKPHQNQVTQQNLDEQRNAELKREHDQAWAEARSIQFSDSDFLQTREPMSMDAIAPYDHHTGLVGNRAYNQIVWVKAIERAKKKLFVENNQLVLTIKSGAEINVAEDIFEYIVDLFKDWNQWVREGRFEIIKTEGGYYDISPANKKKKLR